MARVRSRCVRSITRPGLSNNVQDNLGGHFALHRGTVENAAKKVQDGAKRVQDGARNAM